MKIDFIIFDDIIDLLIFDNFVVSPSLILRELLELLKREESVKI